MKAWYFSFDAEKHTLPYLHLESFETKVLMGYSCANHLMTASQDFPLSLSRNSHWLIGPPWPTLCPVFPYDQQYKTLRWSEVPILTSVNIWLGIRRDVPSFSRWRIDMLNGRRYKKGILHRHWVLRLPFNCLRWKSNVLATWEAITAWGSVLWRTRNHEFGTTIVGRLLYIMEVHDMGITRSPLYM
jgi:hypothetical protein